MNDINLTLGALNTGGWTIMLLSVGFVTTLFAWCIYKVVTTQGIEDHVHTPADIDTGEQQ